MNDLLFLMLFAIAIHIGMLFGFADARNPRIAGICGLLGLSVFCHWYLGSLGFAGICLGTAIVAAFHSACKTA